MWLRRDWKEPLEGRRMTGNPSEGQSLFPFFPGWREERRAFGGKQREVIYDETHRGPAEQSPDWGGKTTIPNVSTYYEG